MAVHYGILHDTVLSTLTAIARGGLDHRSTEVRARCAREAEFLRRLISGESEDEPGRRGLRHALSDVCREAEQLGMRVRCFTDSLPVLPALVVTAISRAVREALNNARLHSGTGKAWVTAVGENGAVTVTVTDRGRGFDQAKAGLPEAGPHRVPPGGLPPGAHRVAPGGLPEAGRHRVPPVGLPPGAHRVLPGGLPEVGRRLGIPRSIMQRMADAGGSATVTSAAGIGTRVELRWPAT